MLYNRIRPETLTDTLTADRTRLQHMGPSRLPQPGSRVSQQFRRSSIPRESPLLVLMHLARNNRTSPQADSLEDASAHSGYFGSVLPLRRRFYPRWIVLTGFNYAEFCCHCNHYSSPTCNIIQESHPSTRLHRMVKKSYPQQLDIQDP